jgi:hypothetical protein
MDEHYPVFSEQGDHVHAALEATLQATGSLNPDELGSVVEVVAASYQKALQLRFVVEALVALPPEDHAALGARLEDVEELLRTLATWHATTQNRLFSAAQRVRTGR